MKNQQLLGRTKWNSEQSCLDTLEMFHFISFAPGQTGVEKEGLCSCLGVKGVTAAWMPTLMATGGCGVDVDPSGYDSNVCQKPAEIVC